MARKQCVIDGCGAPQNARGLCGKHYARWKKHGSPDVVKYSVQKSARVDKYLATSLASCRHHGEHSDWKLRKRADRKGVEYRALECNLCVKERAKKWRERYPEKMKASMGTLSVTASRLFSGAKTRAKKANIPIDISKDWIVQQFEAQRGKCALTGRDFQMEYESGGRRPDALSLDQMVPGAGYTKKNTQLVVWSVNEMKKRMSLDEFLQLCLDVAEQAVRTTDAEI